MVWTQLLLVLLNLTIQAEVERTAFRSESQKILLPLAACDSRGTSATFGQNDTRGITSSSVQSRLTGPLGRTESTLEDLPLGQENRTHERLGTLKNALRGPPPSGWVGTRIGSDVYGRYELGSTVAPKKLPSSPLPDSYMNPKHIVDMEPARSLPGSTLNAGGEVRNANYFWQELLERDPDMFSKGNIYRIEELGMSPKVDKVWLKQNPAHQSFLDDVLHHHHIDKGPIAVPLPETIHQQWTKALHGGVQ